MGCDNMDSKVKYGQEIGKILIKVCKKLLSNDNLIMLLNNTDLDPLNKELHPEKIRGIDYLYKLIKPMPILDTIDQSVTSKLVVLFDEGQITSNLDNENLSLLIIVYSPFKQWPITGEDLRPYAIMSQVRQSLQDRRINGLGELKYTGFTLNNVTEEMASFTMRFVVNAFS